MKIKGKKIFISGGAGFIGSSLANKYIDDNEIVIYDNFDRDSISGTPLASHSNLTIIKGDILDLDLLSSSVQGANIFIHACAIAGIDNTVKNPVRTLEVNTLGTRNALVVAHENISSLERFLDFSTSEVFGSRAYMVEENTNTITGAVGEARWTYAVSKLAGEHLVHSYHKQYSIPTVTVRPFNIYGPGQVGEGAISIMIRKALTNEDILIFGDGSQIRAWCYIQDMIDALHLCLVHENAVGQSFNIGNSRAVTTIYGLAETICRSLDSKSKIVFRDALSADIELRIPSVAKAKELIGFEAKTDLDEGIKQTAVWIRENLNLLPDLAPVFKS